VGLFSASPVYFQPLERELEPVVGYLRGHVLNAGCGWRDISPFLLRHGASEVTRYDIDSQDPSVIRGPIESMPFDDESFDSVLCNAVLEHVHDVDRSMRELVRVVRKGGYIVAAVPFLQPFHASPTDFRRYTAEGLAQLGRNAGLDVLIVLPVHTFAQTLGWILWEIASEKGGRLRKLGAWLTSRLLTRFFNRTDTKLVNNANTFQAVFRRSDFAEANVIGTEWRWRPIATRVPTMLVDDELRLLSHLAESYFRGDGVIVHAGSFLGGSTVALAEGLRRNAHAKPKTIHSFDRFEVEEYTRGTFFPATTEIGSSFRDEFDRNVAPYADLVEVHAGDVAEMSWDGGAIEILFVDVAKSVKLCDWVTWTFFPHLIPGRSLVVQQDYFFHHWVAWIHITMELYADYFEYVTDTGVNSAVFLNTKKIPDGVLRRHGVEELPLDEKIALMDRAAARFAGPRREMILSAKAHFLDMLKAP